MTQSYQGYSKSKGFNPIQVSNQNISNIRAEGNRIITGMQAQRDAEINSRNAFLQQTKENQRLEAENRRENFEAEETYYDSLKQSLRTNYETRRQDLVRKTERDNQIYESLANLSEEAGKIYKDVLAFNFMQDYEDELSKGLLGFVDPNKQVAQTVGETAIQVQEARFQAGADILQADGADPLVVERVRASSPGRQFARDQLSAANAQQYFPDYLARAFATDDTTQVIVPGRDTPITPIQAVTAEEKMLVGNTLAFNYLKQSGLYGLKPDFLLPTLTSFRKSIGSVVQEARRAEIKSLEEDRINEALDGAYDKVTAPDIAFGSVYQAFLRSTNDRGEPLSRGDARKQAIDFFVDTKDANGNPRFSDQELQVIFGYSFPDQPNKSIAERYSPEIAAALDQRREQYIAIQTQKDRTKDAEQREFVRQIEERLAVAPEELTEDTLKFMREQNRALGNPYLDKLIQRLEQSTPTALEQESIKADFDERLEDGSLTARAVNESRLTRANKKTYIDKLTEYNMLQGGISDEDDKTAKKYITAQLKGAFGFTGKPDEFADTQVDAIRNAQNQFRKDYALALRSGSEDPYGFAKARFDVELGKGNDGLYAISGEPQSRVFTNFTPDTVVPELSYNGLVEKVKINPQAYRTDVLVSDDQVTKFISEAAAGRIPTLPNSAYAASNIYGGKLSAMDIMLGQADRMGLTVPPALVQSVEEVKSLTADSPLRKFMLNYKPNYTRTQISLIDQTPGAWRQPENLNPVIVNGTRSDYVGSSNVVDAGYKDYQNRPIMLAPAAAAAFNKMVDDGMPLDRITNVYRDESEYLRLRSKGYGAVPNSAHNYGEAMDVHGAAGEWLKQYGPQYGWYLIDYDGSHGGHFEYRGN